MGQDGVHEQSGDGFWCMNQFILGHYFDPYFDRLWNTFEANSGTYFGTRSTKKSQDWI